MPSREFPHGTVGGALDGLYSILCGSRHRSDYVYRVALTEKILLGRHSLRTATLLHEVRAGSSKADVVVFNGTATAYEIKSERDSLARLSSQIGNYRQVFASVNVVAAEAHVSKVLKEVPVDVGVVILTERQTLHTERAAKNLPERTNPVKVLDMLRVSEALDILENLGLRQPSVPNTRMRAELTAIFSELPSDQVHHEMVQTLKARRSQAELSMAIKEVPKSVRTAFLALRPTARSQANLVSAIRTPLIEAIDWN